MRFFRRLPVAVFALAVMPFAAAAQQPDPNDKTPVHELTLETQRDITNGRIAMIEGEVDAAGLRFVISKLDILQPVAVTLVAPDGSGDDLNLALWKYAEDEVQREGSTRGTGAVSFQFRTEDDLQIRVTSPEGSKRFRLAVWAGDAIDAPVPSPFVSQAGFTGSGTPVLMYVLVAGVLAIAVFLGMIAMRRKA